MISPIRINPEDNVAVAIDALHVGQSVDVAGVAVTLLDDVPAGHKFLLTDLEAGRNVIKYGYPIGRLREDKKCGSLVDHRHIETNLSGLLRYDYTPSEASQPAYCQWFLSIPMPTFQGYKRKDGRVGIRNEVWIVPTVGCVNGVVNQLAQKLSAEAADPQSPLGRMLPSHSETLRVVAYPHNYGCSQLADDHENTRRILRGLVQHPNAGAVLVVGLGCENNQPDQFQQFIEPYDHERIRFMVCQAVENDEVDEGMRILRELYVKAAADQRQPVPVSELRVGLKCGGSDGFSGITANPLLGVLSDYLVAQGGTTVLTEVPEMFGAETILMNRCATRQLFDQTVLLINDFKQYFLSHGQPIGENPSPGNKAGGISTLEEKALGCTQKCGSGLVRGVLSYGQVLAERGLNLLSAPGNDLVASTALAASGCHLVLFTTGRGTPFGTFVPTVKVSTNSTLAQRKPTWIDFNAGTIVEGESMEEVFKRFLSELVDIASGKQTWNEKKGYQEIAIFKNGVTL